MMSSERWNQVQQRRQAEQANGGPVAPLEHEPMNLQEFETLRVKTRNNFIFNGVLIVIMVIYMVNYSDGIK